jgi:hypothetical protein
MPVLLPMSGHVIGASVTVLDGVQRLLLNAAA